VPAIRTIVLDTRVTGDIFSEPRQTHLTHCNTQPQSHCGTNVHVFFHEYLAVFISVQ